MATLRVTVSDRLRVEGDRSPAFEGALLAAFDYPNPDIAKAKRGGRYVGHLPKTIRTWALDGQTLVLPRGGTQRLREVAEQHGIVLRWRDDRLTLPSVDFPPLARKLFPFQRQALDAILAREQGIVRAPTGCIWGQATVGVNRAGKSFDIRLSDLVKMANGGMRSGRIWDPAIPTMVRGRMKDGTVRLVRLVSAWESGVKRVVRVRMASGAETRATREHRFLTDRGWARLGQLRIGDRVIVEDRQSRSKPASPNPWYHLTSGLQNHPYVGRRGVRPGKGGWSVPTHRLVMEARLSGMELRAFISAIKRGDVERLVFLDPTLWVVHHEDGNARNNVFSNLVLMSHAEHSDHHGAENARNVLARTTASEITTLEDVGNDTVYDLELEAPNNFLADGIVVHNSGKTTMALAGIAEVKQPALVVMRDSRLLDQWKRRAVAELGLSEREIGILRGGKRSVGKRLTLALQQTLNSATFPLNEILDRFGSVWVDEAQTVAARTFEAPLNRFRARVRVGFSADETRADRKEFLVYDTMGAVIHEVTLEEAEAAGVVVPVHVLVAQSDFAPAWYLAQGRGERDWNRLMSAVEGHPERNALIVRIVEQLLRDGRAPVLVFTERREHARALADTALFQRGHRCGLLLGGDADITRFTEDRLRLELGQLDIAVGTVDASGQGIDLPRVRGGVIASPIGNNKQFFGQVRGRLARAFHEKTEAWLVYVLDEELFPQQRQRLKRWNRGDVAPFRREG